MKDNKLIAEFYLENIPHEHTFGIALLHMESEAMEYHTSWDWLMPVVEKIGDENLLSIDIDIVYDRVVEFIKEHNDVQTLREDAQFINSNHER